MEKQEETSHQEEIEIILYLIFLDDNYQTYKVSCSLYLPFSPMALVWMAWKVHNLFNISKIFTAVT